MYIIEVQEEDSEEKDEEVELAEVVPEISIHSLP